MHVTARALGLEYNKLKRPSGGVIARVRGEAKRPPKAEPMKFIEVTGMVPASSCGCRVSLQGPDGQRLQLEMATERGDRDGAAAVPVRLGCIPVIQLTAQMRILVAVASIDFRAGIDGLARICRAQLEVDPFCGWLVVFCNRRRTAIKILTYDGQGFWVCHKRLSQGKFPYWPTDGPIQELRPISCRCC